MSKARSNVIKLNDMVSVNDYGATGNGVTDDTYAIDAAEAAAMAGGGWLLFPTGSYLYGGTVYEVIGQSMVLNRDWDAVGYNPSEMARGQAITILAETPDTTPQDHDDSRQAIAITMQANGSQHGTGIRVNLRNYSDDGNGCTGVYVKPMSDTGSNWTAGYHVEPRHAATAGGTFGVNIECSSYTTTGNMYGIVVHNNTATTGDTTHPLTGAATAQNDNAYGIHVLGNNTTDPKGGWVRGINFSTQSMRAGGDCIYVGCDAAIDSVLATSSATASALADIYLKGDSTYGIVLEGTYTDAALKIATDQYIGLQNSNGVKMRYDSGNDRFEVVKGALARFSVDTSATPVIKLSGVQVVQERITGWAAASNTKSRATFDTSTVTTAQLAQRVGQLIDDLISHGMIGT
jgi:hypothetical protein